jgi:hypothetical protein
MTAMSAMTRDHGDPQTDCFLAFKLSNIFPVVRLGGPVFWLKVRGWYREAMENVNS